MTTVKLKTITPKEKLVFINGEKCGLVSKESREGPNTLSGRPNKSVDWRGRFCFYGKEYYIGATFSVVALEAKIKRMIADDCRPINN